MSLFYWIIPYNRLFHWQKVQNTTKTLQELSMRKQQNNKKRVLSDSINIPSFARCDRTHMFELKIHKKNSI